jgi:ABC-type multidrug transport system ATPase subunit
MTTRQHLEFYARAKGISAVKQNVDLVTARTGLGPYQHRPAYKLSGGNKRKLSLAIALIGRPTFFPMSKRVPLIAYR